MSVAVLIPAYNEAATLPGVAQQAARLYPVIVVDDGSADGTAAAVQGCHGVTLLAHSENRGKGASLCRGFSLAAKWGAEWVVTLDADGQHLPEDIPRLVAAAQATPGALIIGERRYDRSSMPPARRFANAMACFWISWAAGRYIPDTQSGFRVYPLAALLESSLITEGSERFAFESEVLMELAGQQVPVVSVPIAARYPQQARQSYYSPWTDTCAIIQAVARRLIRRRLYLQGLYRSQKEALLSKLEKP
nr:glycosyltransferase family 2 protein [Halorhodospira abdelmalekii]